MEAECKEFITQLLPCLIKLVTSGLENSHISIPQTILAAEYLSTSYSPSDIDVYELRLPRSYVASLVASMFLCLVAEDKRSEFHWLDYSDFFFVLEQANRQKSQVAKYKMIVNYFRHIQCNGLPAGTMTFRRQVFSRPFEDLTEWSDSSMLCDFEVRDTGSIEDNPDEVLQTDFANEYIGGGTLSGGRVQEEIMFCACPELQVSMLFMERMKKNESIQMKGFQPFSKYTGYSDSLEYAGPWEKEISRDDDGTPQTYVTAIDAIPFGADYRKQYKPAFILRDLNKAYVGMHQPQPISTNKTSSQVHKRAVATGNWGCGVFGGDPQLKSLLLHIAATKAQCEKVIYYTFKDKRVDQLSEIAVMLKGMRMESLMKLVLNYCGLNRAAKKTTSLFGYIKSEMSTT
ncbi:uncharacterized protein [Watersipora subatra]